MKKAQSDEIYKTDLRSRGLKATPARLAVLAYLDGVKQPVTVEEILDGVHKAAVDPATVYRTLRTLKDEDVVKQIDFQHGHAHYELRTRGDHHHIVCVHCGKIEDFHGCYSDAIIPSVLKKTKLFAHVVDHSLELFGVCKTCARSK